MDAFQRRSPAPVLALTILALGAAGCTSSVTNLTPTALPRESSGLYRFEAEWNSTQRSRDLRSDSIRGWVVLDHKFYPMDRVPRLKDRWESDVPIASTNRAAYYYFKWDYATAGFGHDNPNSLRSKLYRVEITDPPSP